RRREIPSGEATAPPTTPAVRRVEPGSRRYPGARPSARRGPCPPGSSVRAPPCGLSGSGGPGRCPRPARGGYRPGDRDRDRWSGAADRRRSSRLPPPPPPARCGARAGAASGGGASVGLGRHDAADGRPIELESDLVGHLDGDALIGQLDDGAVQTARHHHTVARLDCGEHGFAVTPLLLLWANEEEGEDRGDRGEERELHEHRATTLPARCLGRRVRILHDGHQASASLDAESEPTTNSTPYRSRIRARSGSNARAAIASRIDRRRPR